MSKRYGVRRTEYSTEYICRTRSKVRSTYYSIGVLREAVLSALIRSHQTWRSLVAVCHVIGLTLPIGPGAAGAVYAIMQSSNNPTAAEYDQAATPFPPPSFFLTWSLKRTSRRICLIKRRSIRLERQIPSLDFWRFEPQYGGQTISTTPIFLPYRR